MEDIVIICVSLCEKHCVRVVITLVANFTTLLLN